MFPFITIGPFAIPSKPFIFIIGIYVALWLVDEVLGQIDAEPEWVRGVGFNSLVAGLIGGRIIFALTHWEATLANPVSVIWPITVGYSLWGSVLIGLLALIYYSRQQGINPIQILDAFVTPLLAILAAWVMGDYLGGPGFGTSSNLSWLATHPVQIYEIAVVLLAFWVHKKSRPFSQFDGYLSLVTAAVLAFGFLITLNFRGGSATILGGWQINQLTAFLCLILALGALVFLSPKERQESLTSS